MSKNTGLEIAIIGMAGRFPGASDVNEFWNNLKNGVESISFFSDSELESESPGRAINNSDYVKANAYIENKEYFDSAFFGYLPEEANLMDPQLRIFHELCWKALEDAGHRLNYTDSKVGLFAGGRLNINWMNYSMITNRDNQVDSYTASQLSDITYLCSRISYLLNLQGPSMFVNTACSTSLVAVQRAYMSLLLRECDVALAGGITVNNSSKRGYIYRDGMINSRDGHCRTFDENASGTVGGEGGGVVVLKRLSDAVKNRDNIYAVIKGGSVNNDGNRKMSFTAPSVEGQFVAIVKALNMAKVEPHTIGYIEAHGTGTKLGDPIEVEALNLAFGKADSPYCALGAVKTNIGHLDVAAGVAGLIKTTLVLKNRQIPSTLHFKKFNPKINTKESPFYVNTSLQDWKKNGHPLRAGVSSLGIGGTNAHVILEEAPDLEPSPDSQGAKLLVVSGKTEAALRRNVQNLTTYLSENKSTNLSDVAYTLKVGRTPFEYRKVVVCSNQEEADIGLRQLIAHNKRIAPVREKVNRAVVFMFTGQGSQYLNMGYGLYTQIDIFRSTVDRCLQIIHQKSGKDLRPIMFGDAGEKKPADLDRTEFTQPALFIYEYALAQVLIQWGLKPDAMIGHSIGEYVAACISGVFSLEDALMLVMRRGELMQQAAPGKMLSLSISEDSLTEYLKKHTDISLAAINNSGSCVVSGAEPAIEKFSSAMESLGHTGKILRTSHAFHSSMMDDILADYERVVRMVTLNSPQIPFISNLTGKNAIDAEITDPTYWVRQLRQTVKFSMGIESLMQQENVVFIEVGPGKALGAFVRAHKNRKEGHAVINLARRAEESGSDDKHLLAGIGDLWLDGIELNWEKVYNGQNRRILSLPTYSFEPIKYPAHVNAAKLVAEMMSRKSSDKIPDSKRWLYEPAWKLCPEADVPSGHIDATSKCILLVTDDSAICEAIGEQYKAFGNRVVYLRPGKSYHQQSLGNYCLNPSSDEQYVQFFTDLKENKLLPDCIVHGWGLTALADNDYTITSFETCFYSLVQLAKHCQAIGGIFDKQFVLLTIDLHPVFNEKNSAPVKSLSLAFLKVLAQEYPSVLTTLVDIDSSIDDQALAAKICNEAESRSTGKIVSYQQGRKWELLYDPVRLDKRATANPISDGGVYLITGGLGDFGFTVADYIVNKRKGAVILIGRSALPVSSESELHSHQESAAHEKLKRMQILERNGKAIYLPCDVSDYEQLLNVIKEAEEKLGPIRGVVHTAGLVTGHAVNPLSELTHKDYVEQFQSKVLGLHNLRHVFSGRELDFCLLTSSLSAILGGIGFGAYAPANIYMDYFVRKYTASGELKNWISVNFDGVNFPGKGGQIEKDELEDVLDSILKLKNHPQVIVSVSDLRERLERWVRREETGEPAVDSVRPAPVDENGFAGTGENNPSDPVQSKLLTLWRNFFGKPELSVHDDFFEVGGDSLKALTMIGRIHKVFGIEISVRDFFGNPTIDQLQKLVAAATHQDSAALNLAQISVPKAASKENYEVSSVQKRLFFLYALDQKSLTYNSLHIFNITGKLDKEHFRNTFVKLIDRHEALRTSFRLADDRPVQQIDSNVQPEIEFYQSANAGEIESICRTFSRPFDLSRSPLLRVGLIEVEKEKGVLLIDIHHIITDGVSNAVLIRDFIALYHNEQLPPLQLQYKDFSEWQQSPVYQQKVYQHKAFWLKEFEDGVVLLQLPTNYPRPAIKTYAGDSFKGTINIADTVKLKAIAEAERTTMYMVMLSIYTILLSKLSHQEDIVVGTDLAGRPHADLEQTLGVFVSTIPFRTHPKSGISFKQFLNDVKAKTLACIDNQSYPYDELVNTLNVERNTSRNPLFDVAFAYQNFERVPLKLHDLILEEVAPKSGISKFELSFTAEELNNEISFTIEYSTELFKPTFIARCASYLQKVVQSVIEDINVSLADIEIVVPEEKHNILKNLNDTFTGFPMKETFVSLFEKQAVVTPERIAVIDRDQKLSYRELNEQANKLAAYLIEHIPAQSNIPVFMDPCVELLVCMLGIWKARMVYSPVGTSAPLSRVIGHISDLDAFVLITKNEFITVPEQFYDTLAFETAVEHIIFFEEQKFGLNRISDTDNETSKTTDREGGVEDVINPGTQARFKVITTNELQNYDVNNVPLGCSPDDLCYIIYTSGSTGRPKGAMIHNQGMLNHLFAKINDLQITESDVIAQTAPAVFDISIWQFLSGLLRGAQCFIIRQDVILKPRDLMHALDRGGVTIFESVPSLINTMLDEFSAGQMHALADLRWMMLTGEPLTIELAKKWIALFPEVKLLNAYGPTEASDDVTHYVVAPPTTDQVYIPIGKPVQNIHIYIFDANMHLCPPDVRGEIYVAGLGVGRGYWKDKEKTERAFLPNPLAGVITDDYPTIYKTGDIGYYQEDGNIVCMGRLDEQVKIRGNRIELREIEIALSDIDAIREVSVLAREVASEKLLVAYYVAPNELDPAVFIASLSNKLPDYMIPSRYVWLQAFPLTKNGKLDKSALLNKDMAINMRVHEAPAGEIEIKLAELWAEVLKIDRQSISATHNFFELGGHSLRAMVLVNKIPKAMGVEVPLIEVFNQPSLRSLAQLMKGLTKGNASTIKRAEQKEYYAATMGQKRLHFLFEFDGTSLAYNQPQVLKIEGQLDHKKLRKVFKTLVARQETFRTSFEIVNDEPVQVIHAQVEFDIEHCFAPRDQVQATIGTMIRPFDLRTAPLLRVGLVEVSPEEHFLVVDTHHIIMDGVSIGVLVEELVALYNNETLIEPAIQFKDYAEWRASAVNQNKIEMHKAFWSQEFADGIPTLELPTDFERPALKSHQGDSVNFHIGHEEMQRLKTLGDAEGATMFMVLLSAFNILLGKVSNQEDVVVGTPIAGREHSDIQRTLGMFVFAHPLRNQPKAHLSFREFLVQLKAKTLACFEHQAYQFEASAYNKNTTNSRSHNPLFDVLFILQNFEGFSTKSIPGLKFVPCINEGSEAKFDLTLTAVERQDKISLNFEYSTKLFKRETIERFVGYFHRIINAIVVNNDVKIFEIDILSEQEQRQQLVEFNHPVQPRVQSWNATALFEEAVRNYPLKTGLTFKGRHLVYEEMNSAINQLAHFLIHQRHVVNGTIVGLYFERSTEMILAILAVLKAGGTYVALDPNYPDGRVEEILMDCKAQIIITNVTGKTVPIPGVDVVNLSEYRAEIITCSAVNPRVAIKESDVAYIIYTSGSTGKPKGIQITHAALADYALTFKEYFQVTENDKVVQQSALTFDTSIEEIFPALISAAEVLVMPDGAFDIDYLVDSIRYERATILTTTPLVLKQLNNHAEHLKSLRVIISGGDVLFPDYVNDLFDICPLYNTYGPSESTVCVSYHQIKELKTAATVGKPIRNRHVLILGNGDSLCPIGTPGEICVSGTGLAKGYLNQPTLTQKKFVDNPYLNGARMYRTGDKARWLQDGSMEFVGRMDSQLKLRGYRIELGEVERHLERHPQIHMAVVVAKEADREKFLVAYYVADDTLEVSEMRTHLMRTLPDYMVPAFYMRIPKIPLTVNGKLDANLLPAPQVDTRLAYEAPATDIEEELVKIWAGALKLDADIISVTSSFFELGGHSLNAVAVINNIYKTTNVKLSLRDFFMRPTVRDLAKCIEAHHWLENHKANPVMHKTEITI